MGLLIVKDDFVGKYELAKSINDKIDSYIQQYEEVYLMDLLGSKLFDLFKSDIVDYLPQTNIYLTIFNPINTDLSGFEIRSKGIKEMLLGFIYFEYERDNRYKSTNIGQVVNKSETSTNEFDNSNLYQRYNESISTYRNIQNYISLNIEDYSDYNGQKKIVNMFL